MELDKRIIIGMCLTVCSMQVWAQQIKGIVSDAKTNETLIGALIAVEGSDSKAVTDIEGAFAIDGLESGMHTLSISYIGYKPVQLQVETQKGNVQVVKIALNPDEQQLDEITVTAAEVKNNDVAMIRMTKQSALVTSCVSAQEISRTQDTNAGEVIRRVSGISLIDDKFVMVRGLSQRYNNVWVNGGGGPYRAVRQTRAPSPSSSYRVHR